MTEWREGLAYWAGKVYWGAEGMVGKKMGRPTEYEPVEDAILLNTYGEGEEHTNSVLERAGYRRHTKDSLTSRRNVVGRTERTPSPDGYVRLGRIASMRAQLELRLSALTLEEDWLRGQLGLSNASRNSP